MVSILRDETTLWQPARPNARPWERTGSVDVEALAAWAYGAQQVDRFERAGLHAIEAAACGFEPRGFSADGVGQLMAIEHLGARIDNGGVSVSDAVHPVAYAVAAALGQCEEGRAVRYHALSGTRPRGWMPPEHHVRAAIWVKPGVEAQVEYQGPGRKGGYCQVLWTWDAGRQAWGRADYAKWFAGLEELAWRLSQRALGFTVTGPSAPVEPWAEASPISLDPEGEAGGTPHGSSQRSHPQ
jgi:hypothetical protein